MSNDFVTEIAGTGHNSGAEPAEVAGDQIDAALKTQFLERRDALIASAAARVVTDNDSIGRAADTRSMIRTMQEAIWARAKEIAEPNSRAVETVKTRTQRFVAELAAADDGLNQKIVDCREAQRERAQIQRDEQNAREAALRAAAAPEIVSPQIDSGPAPKARHVVEPEPDPVSLPAVRGDYGSRIGDRAVTAYVYADPRKLPRAVLDAPAVEKAIQQALRAYVKLHKVPKGVTTSTDLATTLRRPN